MNVVKVEKIEFSEKEMNAFELVKKCLDSMIREVSNPNIRDCAVSTLQDIYELECYIVGDDYNTPTEEPTEEHCWDERHIPSQFELNP